MANILVVDDKPDITNLVKMIFESRGDVVKTAENGNEAISLLSDTKYDVILMDLMMPELNGYEALKHIRASETHKSTIVLACTARASKQDEDKVLAAGFDGYIVKPFRVNMIKDTVDSYLKR